jgi:glycosyltransferase involved in cell wall biosynthesis
MDQPTLCIIHEAISNDSAIAKVAMRDVRIALDGGWRVSVVAKRLDPSLVDRVEWLKLFVPRRLFFVQWTTAAMFIRRALKGRRFDLIHAHQPQVANISDVFQCHFLTRVAWERRCLEQRPGLRPALVRLQQRGVLVAEDRCYRGWNPATRMIFESPLMQAEFQRLYGAPPRQRLLPPSFGPVDFVTPEQRSEARRRFLGRDWDGPVVGYLGGVQERKGYRRLITALAAVPNAYLLMGGQYTNGFQAPELQGRLKAVGLVSDTAGFYAACDVLAVPSLFEPLGLVAFEAAARGVPVVATEEVGALPLLAGYGLAWTWRADEPLAPLLRQAAAGADQVRRGALRMERDLSAEVYGRRLLELYQEVLRDKQVAEGRTPAEPCHGIGSQGN